MLKSVRSGLAGALVRPGRMLALLLTALLLVALFIPLVVRPVLRWWLLPPATTTTTLAAEPWPTVGATYVAPTVVPTAAADRLQPVPTPMPTPSWRELNYLTVVEFTTSTVVQEERTTEVPLLGEVVSDRLLLKAVGKVQVSIDLSQVRDVTVGGTKITLTAPKPAVTSVELLPQRSQIFERTNVWLLSQYPGLESAALEQARQQMRAEIDENESMLRLAQEFARLQLTEFLQKAGFHEVEIHFDEGGAMDG